MNGEPGWRVLHSTDDLDRAVAVTTTIASMGYDVQCADARGTAIAAEGQQPMKPPFLIRVREQDFAELAEVLEEMIAEQEEFDAMLAGRALREGRRRRIMLVALIIVIAALAMLGLLQV